MVNVDLEASLLYHFLLVHSMGTVFDLARSLLLSNLIPRLELGTVWIYISTIITFLLGIFELAKKDFLCRTLSSYSYSNRIAAFPCRRDVSPIALCPFPIQR